MSISTDVPEAIKYPNQPLREVVTEIRFKGELTVESKRHELFEAIRDQYPNLYVPNALPGLAPALQHYRFERDDRLAGVSVALNSVGYFEREYSGAAVFIPEANRLFTLADEIFQIRKITRIGWRYINEVPFVRESGMIPLGSFLTEPPNLFAISAAGYNRVSFSASTRVEDCSISVRLESDESEKDGSEVLYLDIDVCRDQLDEQEFDTSSIAATVKQLHRLARNFFEQSITDNYRAYLKGESYE